MKSSMPSREGIFSQSLFFGESERSCVLIELAGLLVFDSVSSAISKEDFGMWI